MHAIRDVVTVKSNRISYQLPAGFSGQKVELIVLAIDEQESIQDNIAHRSQSSLRGALKTFANPSLIDSENQAWKHAVGIKHEKN